MYFLNLSLLQFLAVFGSISAISVALYLLDRSRRKLVVSTLRFWIAAEQPAGGDVGFLDCSEYVRDERRRRRALTYACGGP